VGVVLLIVWSIHYRNSIYEVSSSPFAEEVQEYKQKELIEIPHDTQCYTQGLSFINSTHILESCGIYRRSYFHILEYEQQGEDKVVTKEVYKSKTFEDKYFLEGSVHFPPNNLIYFLTWRENIVFRYDSDTLEEVDRLTWGKDGWGLTHNHSHLIVSDGSDAIYVTDEKMGILEKIKVKDHLGNPKFRLNELEWVQEGKDQFVLANVYETSEIVKINLRTGEIVSSSEFDDLSKKEAKARHFEVLNGIAYNIKSNTYLITGKQWGSMYQMVHL
jgi:glutamine cyclotransferase